jgi:imidazolonepropionase-like amidohydrolase
VSENWLVRGVMLPHGNETEDWWVDAGTLRAGRPPSDGPTAERLPGRFVLPGLVDAHTHLTLDFADGAATVDDVDRALDAQLAAGVLAVRDVGAVPRTDVRRGRDRVERPDVLGGSRFIAPPGTYFPALYVGVEPEVAAAAASAEVADGADWVKVIADSPITEGSFFDPPPTFTPKVLTAIVDAVHEAGGRVAAHVTGVFAREAVLAGVDSIEHGSLVDADLLAYMAEHGVAWTPTAGTVLGGVAQLERAGIGPMLELARPHLEQLRESIPIAERLGVTVLAGTDMLGHGNLASEVAALQELGMSGEAALAAASSTPRAYFGLPGLADGQPAALVTYDSDPRDDPEMLRTPVAIVHAGVRVR